MRERKPRGLVRVHKGRIELSAYAGVNPATGKKERIYDYLPVDGDKDVEVRLTALLAKADELVASRRKQKANPFVAVKHVASTDRERTVAESLEAWWTAHGVHLQGGQERGFIDAYLLPGLGSVQLWRLRSSVDPSLPNARDLVDLTKFFAELRPIRKDTFQVNSLRLISNVLRGALAREIGPGGLQVNPVVGIKLPRGEERESTTPEPEQASAFFKFLREPRVQPARKVTRRVRNSEETVTYELPERVETEDLDAPTRAYARLVMSGPRPQEVSALRRGNYDPATGRLTLLAEGIVRETKPGEPETWVHRRGATAKRRKRTIVLDAAAREDLTSMMARQDEVAAACGKALDRRSYLFTYDPDGTGFVRPVEASRNFDTAVKRARAAGVDLPPDMRLYDMRHFGITRLVRARRDIPTIATRYATSAEMIYRVYAHGSDGDDLADDLDGV